MGNNVVKLLPNCYRIKKVRKKQIGSRRNQKDVHLSPTPVRNANVVHIHDNYDSESEVEDDSRFLCEFCVDAKSLDESFNVKGCAHFYCIECTTRYVMSRLDHNIVYITCPVNNCEGVLDPEYCRGILPRDVFDKWGAALCESVIDNTQKFYCPYAACSALLIKDGDGKLERECPHCKREFCINCKAPCHPNMDCKNYQKLKKKGEDSLLVDLAKKKNWRRCPKCKFYVERSLGCNYMLCRCGCAFCYQCGGSRFMDDAHSCRKCKI